MDVKEITGILNLSQLETRDWAIFKTSAVSGEGLTEALDWLVNSINQKV